MMSLIITLIIGGVVGWLASLAMRTDARMGVLANIAVGVGGSLLGYWVAGALGMQAVGDLPRFVIALGGAMLLIAALRTIGMFRKA